MQRPKKDPYRIAQIKLEGVVLRLYEHIVIRKDKDRGKDSYWPTDPLISSNIELLNRLWKEIVASKGKE